MNVILEHYNWMAGLVTIACIIGVVFLGQKLVFSIPAIAQTREFDKAQNKDKWRNKATKYHHRVFSSQKIGAGFTLVFYFLVQPFIVTLEPQPVWKVLLDVFLILMIYDFFYYLTHRFVFHGQGYFRMVHAVHHQARSRVSSIDSHLLHPTEIFIGIALFYVVTVSYALAQGHAFHFSTLVITSVIYTQINQINHCRIDLDHAPWKTLNWIAMKHDAHHLDMHKGNFATITLLYDRMFGTLETHPMELGEKKEAAA
ncbi:sterol desaturase family protein [bacterium]|nr:sterol desaturase family protein [bacterium]